MWKLNIVVSIVAILLQAYFADSAFKRNVNPLFCANTRLPFWFQKLNNNQLGIINGDEAQAGQFPYQVLIEVTTLDRGFLCGGSLISKDWVLTAAHCLDQNQHIKEVRVTLGALKKNDNEPAQKKFYINLEDIIVHEQWDEKEAQSDIALAKLPEPVEFTERIAPILLPRTTDESLMFEGARVVTSGWGATSDGSRVPANTLRYVISNVLNFEVCDRFYCSSLVEKYNICMDGIDGKSTCKGDSGGPLATCDGQGSVILIGITSFGFIGCEYGYPSVYTRVTSYLSWIYNHTSIQPR